MKKGLIYAALAAAALMLPRKDMELAKIKPIETVSVRYLNGSVMIETDTGDTGTGKTTEEAVQNLKDTTSGVVYLDTTRYLLVEDGAKKEIPRLTGLLKRNVRVCGRKGEIDLQAAGEYLAVHMPEKKLAEVEQGQSMQILEMQNGRLKLS